MAVQGLVIDKAHCIKKCGESFRSILLQLGEICSILPKKINVMALTATITQSVRMQLEKLFERKDHHSIVLNPCKLNITYFLSEYKILSETFAPLLRGLRDERTICPCTIIYCVV